MVHHLFHALKNSFSDQAFTSIALCFFMISFHELFNQKSVLSIRAFGTLLLILLFIFYVFLYISV